MASADRGMLHNPVASAYDGPLSKTATFTIQGAALKTLFLLAIVAATFGYTWNLSTQGYAQSFEHLPKDATSISIPSNVYGLASLGCFGGFIVAMIIIFNQRTAPYLSPVYAALEGLVLGAVSAGFEARYPGIALEAAASTLCVSFGVFVLYATKILQPTQGFVVGLLAAMLGILGLYVTDMIMTMFGSYVPVLHDKGWVGIGVQVVIVAVAALNLVVDFGIIAESAENRAPKWYEWYGAFGILVTLVWLYLEIIRLLAKTRKD